MSRFTLATALLLALAGPTTLASRTEPALAFATDDPGLAWGPCPAFIPEGCQIAVLHGDPALANADVFFKVPGDFTIPHHWHTSAERMVLVIRDQKLDRDAHKAVARLFGTGQLHRHALNKARGTPQAYVGQLFNNKLLEATPAKTRVQVAGAAAPRPNAAYISSAGARCAAHGSQPLKLVKGGT